MTFAELSGGLEPDPQGEIEGVETYRITIGGTAYIAYAVPSPWCVVWVSESPAPPEEEPEE
jgi:hypothetical protein